MTQKYKVTMKMGSDSLIGDMNATFNVIEEIEASSVIYRGGTYTFQNINGEVLFAVADALVLSIVMLENDTTE